MEPIIEVKHLKKSFGDLEVLHDIDFTVSKGEVVTIIGASGSGKSTFLRCLNILETPNGGSVMYHGKDILKGEINVNVHRSKVGMVFQSFNLFNNKSVLENCVIGQMKVLKRNREEATKIAMRYLKKVGMERFAKAGSMQLSGGQKQRVAIARALCMNPDLANDGLTMIVVTHEMQFARDVSSRVVFMDDGVIVEEGSPDHIFNHPTQARTKEFLKRYLNQ